MNTCAWIRIVMDRSAAVSWAEDHRLDVFDVEGFPDLAVVEGEHHAFNEELARELAATCGPFLAEHNGGSCGSYGGSYLSAGTGAYTPIALVGAVEGTPALRLDNVGITRDEVERAITYLEVAQRARKELGLCNPDARPLPVVDWLRGLLKEEEKS